MINQNEIDRLAKLAGITPLQAYYNLSAIKGLRQSGELAKAGYRHLLK